MPKVSLTVLGMREIWKNIRGFEGCYQVSNQGRVRTLEHKITFIRDGKPVTRTCPARILSGKPGNAGYPVVNLTIENVVSRRCIHRLVANAFLKNPMGKPFVLHKDGVKINNFASNLYYGTQSENMTDAYNHGYRGEKRHNAILTAKQVRLFKSGKLTGSYSSIARQLGISIGCLAAIRQGRTWRHL